MDNLKLYEINSSYITYLSAYAPHLFQNKKSAHKNERDPHYRALLLAEYRFIKSIQEKIWKNAQNVYKIKIKDGEGSSLAKRCNDFLLLEKVCADYMK